MSTNVQPTTTDVNTFTKPSDPVVDGTTTAHATKADHTTREAFEKLEEDLKETKDAAVKDGQQDVEAATATYFEKALHIADVGLSTAQTYITAGKEKLQGPAPDKHNAPPPPSGIKASLTSTAAAALDVAHRGLGVAQQTIHDRQAGHPTSTSVTLPTKPAGEHLADAQAAAQPHVDAAKANVAAGVDAAKGTAAAASATAAPYVEKAQQTAAPHVQKAQDTVAPVVQKAQDAAAPYVKSAFDAAEPYATKATEVVQPKVDAAADTVNSVKESDKPLTQQGAEALTAAQATVKEQIPVAKEAAQKTIDAINGAEFTTPKPTEPTDAPTVV